MLAGGHLFDLRMFLRQGKVSLSSHHSKLVVFLVAQSHTVAK